MISKKSFVFLFIIALNALVYAGNEDPVLKLNLKMHIGKTTKADFDKNEKYLITSSEDGTVILWDYKSGEYIKTFRTPLNLRNPGKIYGAAISPDAKVVVACNTREDKDPSGS